MVKTKKKKKKTNKLGLQKINEREKNMQNLFRKI